MAVEVRDGHGWVVIWRDLTHDREVAICRGEGCNCGVRKFRDGGNWVIADVAPWVDRAHVDSHARAMASPGVVTLTGRRWS